MSLHPGRSFSNREVEKEISVTPWYNAAQFKKVYEYLYSSELVKKRWAVDQISVWETRCHPSLPAPVEASLVISRAIIQDILLTNGASLCQEHDIQMMYSMALVRFVNLTVENSLKGQPVMVTRANIAKRLGIPSWIVDLRNEASHSFCPSLPSLRMAAEAAMKYLNESYWEKETSILKNFEKEPFNGRKIRKMIQEYMSLQLYVLNNMKMKNTEQFSVQVSECTGILQRLAFMAWKNKREFIRTFISDGLFIPFDEDLKTIVSPADYLQYQEVYDENYTGPKSIPSIPVELEDFWKRMLNMLNMLQCIPLLLEELLKSQADRTEMGKKLVISWVMKILRIHCLGYSYEEGSLRKLFRKKGIIIDWHSLFYAAVCRPCLYTPYIFPLIFSHLDLKENVTRYILNLMAITLGQADWKSVKLPSNHSIYTVDNLKKMKHLQDAKKKRKRKRSDEYAWSVPQDICYKSWPIGFVINPLDEAEKTDEQCEEFITAEEFDETMDFTDKCFLGNENDNEEEYVAINDEPNTEDEMDLGEIQSFLYKNK